METRERAFQDTEARTSDGSGGIRIVAEAEGKGVVFEGCVVEVAGSAAGVDYDVGVFVEAVGTSSAAKFGI